jgi:hypothetical protein
MAALAAMLTCELLEYHRGIGFGRDGTPHDPLMRRLPTEREQAPTART